MPDKSIRIAGILGLLVAVACFSGCSEVRFSSTVLNPFNMKLPFLPYQQPVRIGIVHRNAGVFDPTTWDQKGMGSPWNPLRIELERVLNKPVQIEDLKLFQLAAHLQSGRLDFAFFSAEDYAELQKEFGQVGQVLAISKVSKRQGLIVARAESEVQSMEDIRGRRFAFGPRGDKVLFDAALSVLESSGVKAEEIKKEILPIPNSYQYHISSAEAAFEVVYGLGTDVGVIEASEYEEYPDSGGSFLLRSFGKDNFRVLARTQEISAETIAKGPFLASAEANPEDVKRVIGFLLTDSGKQKRVFAAMGLSGFQAPHRD